MPKLTSTQLDRIERKIRIAAQDYRQRCVTAMGPRPAVPTYTPEQMKALIESGEVKVVHPPLDEFNDTVYRTFAECFEFPLLPGQAEAEAAAKVWDEGVEAIEKFASTTEERLLDEAILGDGMEALKRIDAAFAIEGA